VRAPDDRDQRCRLIQLMAAAIASNHLHSDVEERRPRNMLPNKHPTEGFCLEADGKLKSQHPTVIAARHCALCWRGLFGLQRA
jgi:hypothetical protein